MKTLCLVSCSIAALFAAVASSFAAAISGGDLLVSRVGDGTAFVSSGGPIAVLEYTGAGSLVQTITISSSPTAGLQVSGNASSEGALTLGTGGFTIAGYIPPFTGTGSLSGRTDTAAPRGVVTVAFDGTFTGPTAVGAFSGNNIRGAVTIATGLYLAGGTTGTIYRSGGVNTTVQSTVANTRVVDIQNGNLYLSTGSGTQGIYGFSGVPTSAGNTPTAILTGVVGQGINPDFTFSSDGNTLYVADATLGVQKFIFNAGAWSLAYNITATGNGITGVAVDFAGPNPVIYAASPTDIFKFTDAGTGGAATSIASAGTNYAFRGLAIASVPEPSALVSILGGAGLLFTVRRRRRY